jgi:nicotinate phosphoribosyltransferase
MTFHLAALAKEKTFRLMTRSQGSLLFSEFGTRRRRSHKVHEAVIKGLIAGDREWASSEDGKKVLSLKKTPAAGGLAGTSNVSHSGS